MVACSTGQRRTLQNSAGMHLAQRHSLLFIINYMVLNACLTDAAWKSCGGPFIDPQSKIIATLVSLGQKNCPTQPDYDVPETCLLL